MKIIKQNEKQNWNKHFLIVKMHKISDQYSGAAVLD